MARKSSRRRRKASYKKPITRVTRYTRTPVLGYRKQKRLRTIVRKTRPKLRTNLKRSQFLRLSRTHRKRVLNQRARVPTLALSNKKRLPSPIELRKALICKNRHVRRQVLHAKNKTGRAGQKKPIRRHPDVRCK